MHPYLSTAAQPRTRRGFTLIEVMVSLMILSVMSIMAWQGLDGMVRARDITEGSVKRTLRLQSVMKQWEADMLAVVNVNTVPPLSFNGATVRLTRRSQGGAQVVVWTLRKGRWIRWAGPPVATVGPLLDQWEQSQHIRGVVPGALVALAGVQQWQVQYFRNGNWTNAQSTGDQVPTLAQAAAAQSQGQFGESLPMGVRCLLSLGEGSGFTGRITRDVQLAPQPGQQ